VKKEKSTHRVLRFYPVVGYGWWSPSLPGRVYLDSTDEGAMALAYAAGSKEDPHAKIEFDEQLRGTDDTSMDSTAREGLS
jgi:hypothetical protein